jgi:RNA polymerase primary sigma factor
LEIIKKELDSKEEKVIVMIFWLNWEKTYTIEEMRKEFWVTREKIRQIEEKALWKLKRSREFRELVR